MSSPSHNTLLLLAFFKIPYVEGVEQHEERNRKSELFSWVNIITRDSGLPSPASFNPKLISPSGHGIRKGVSFLPWYFETVILREELTNSRKVYVESNLWKFVQEYQGGR